jgi:hypothetical protein
MRSTRPVASVVHGVVGALVLALGRPSIAEGAPTPWWLRTDLGPPDPASPLAQMWTPSIDDAIGSGGLRLSSAGQGGGATPRGVALSHAIATVGHGEGLEDLSGFDGRDALAEHQVAKAPPSADRHIPPDVIKRVVHDNYGRFESCYEVGLRSNKTLEGRVVIKFVIDRAGTVAFAADAGSDLPDDGVVACVVRAFDTLVFPEGSDSVVAVVYGLALNRSERSR